ncbi:CTB family bacteriocin [Nostoc sp. UHCC 0926]|uniref:CTB family bacteriocin n=1 Tax=unclassified Nostoc TaxID=2593658 RepID=UPI002361B50B|nr:CTB family bacteriocin [Nostoc sp. UHCC 0926]WDD33624.1 CTB family bacteriocin [Nostoc sp. UHCC 0926]WDD33625.1 CTB family bacteriocin [Nostoc sp. UHCC 0926]
MSHELFTDLSTEQQESVAGGAAVFEDTFYSLLKLKTATISPVYSMSGPGGSSVSGGGVQTLSLNLIKSGTSFKALVD